MSITPENTHGVYPDVMVPDPLELALTDGRLTLSRGAHAARRRPVHAWVLAFCDDPLVERGCLTRLSAEERERAERFVAPGAYRHFVQTRAALRLLLAYHLGCAPEAVVFDYGDYGKPFLTQETPLRFNVAHSGSHALLALAEGCELGVDIEQCRATADLDGLATMVFSAGEHRAWKRLPLDARTHAFFEAWTAKEAVVKAVGRGLGLGLPEVELYADAPMKRLGEANAKAGTLGECRVLRVQAPEGYSAALAVWASAPGGA